MNALITQLYAVGASDQQIDQLLNAWADLGYEIKQGTATSEDAARVTAALASLMITTGIPAVNDFAASFGPLANLVAAAAGAIADLNNQVANIDRAKAFDAAEYVAGQKLLNDMTADELSLHNEIARVRAETERLGIADQVGEERITELAKERLAAEERRRQLQAGAKAGAKAESETEREAKAVADLISQLEYEQTLLGMTAAEQEVANALRRAGAAATDEQRQRIEELVLATNEEEEAIKRMEEASKAFQDIAERSVKGFINDLRSGKSAAEALSNVFDDIASQLIDIAVKNLVGAAFGGFGGGGFNPLGFLFGKATGGPVRSGQSYIVGERGPELFTPSSGGNITTNRDMKGSMGGGEVVVYVQSSEYFDAHVETISGNVSARVTSAGISEYDNNLSSRMVEQNARNS